MTQRQAPPIAVVLDRPSVTEVNCRETRILPTIMACIYRLRRSGGSRGYATLITVLHVEDDADIREIAEMSLGMSGEFQLIQCESGELALQKVAEMTPDLILLDMMMPGLTGIETLQEMRKLPHLANVPAVFMSARAQMTDLEDLAGLGAVDVISKPFDPLELPDQIKAVLQAM